MFGLRCNENKQIICYNADLHWRIYKYFDTYMYIWMVAPQMFKGWKEDADARLREQQKKKKRKEEKALQEKQEKEREKAKDAQNAFKGW